MGSSYRNSSTSPAKRQMVTWQCQLELSGMGDNLDVIVCRWIQENHDIMGYWWASNDKGRLIMSIGILLWSQVNVSMEDSSLDLWKLLSLFIVPPSNSTLPCTFIVPSWLMSHRLTQHNMEILHAFQFVTVEDNPLIFRLFCSKICCSWQEKILYEWILG